jgi:hypothetical protein
MPTQRWIVIPPSIAEYLRKLDPDPAKFKGDRLTKRVLQAHGFLDLDRAERKGKLRRA